MIRWTKSEKAAKRRELAAWIALKREQLGSQIRALRAELAQQIAGKRRRLTQELRGPAQSVRAELAQQQVRKEADARFAAYRKRETLPGSGYETAEDFDRRTAGKVAKLAPVRGQFEDATEFAQRMERDYPKRRAAKKKTPTPKKRAAPKPKKKARAKRR